MGIVFSKNVFSTLMNALDDTFEGAGFGVYSELYEAC